MSLPSTIFDSGLLRARHQRARRAATAPFLLERATADVLERLSTVQRTFTRVVDVGTPAPILADALRRAFPGAFVARLGPHADEVDAIGDIERLALAPSGVDCITSALCLHNANDLPGALLQIRRALVPDGLFIACLAGGRTLQELRTVLTEAELETTGGASPRVSPFADIRDMGALLQRAGFALPVVDSETIVARYDDMFALMSDLRAMGSTNILADRTRRPTRRAVFAEAARRYAERYGDGDGRIRATFEIIWLSGWAPHPSQAKPAKRGSATIGLAEALGASSGARKRE